MNKITNTLRKRLFKESLKELLDHMSPYPARLYHNSSVFNVDIDGEIVTITIPDTLVSKLEEN